MSEPKDFSGLSRAKLLALVVELQRQMAELRASNEALRAEIDQLTHSGKRQDTSFSRGLRVTDPQLPGRKAGSGTFRYRGAPPPEALTEPPVEVPMTLERCPSCGGPLAAERVDLLYTTELAEMPRRQAAQY